MKKIIYSLGVILLCSFVYSATGYLDPNGDSTVQWSYSTGANHYTEVDEGTRQPTAPTITDYVEADGMGDTPGAYELFDMETISTPSISEITAWVYVESCPFSSISIALDIGGSVTSSQDMGEQCSKTWVSATFNSGTDSEFPITSQSEIDGMKLKIIHNSGGPGTREDVYAAYLEVTYTSANDTTNPNVTLSSPSNNSKTTLSTAIFQGNFTDDTSLANATFYLWNSTGDLVNNTLSVISGTNYQLNLSVNLPNEDAFTWNYYGCDWKNNCVWSETNSTLTYGIPALSLSSVYPSGNVNITQNTTFNVSVTVTCNSADCGEINVSLDPPATETNSPGTTIGNFATNPYHIAFTAWTNANNAQSSDGSYATWAGCFESSQGLKATNFGFDIPAGKEIEGIQVNVERKVSSAGGVADEYGRIILSDGSVGTTNKVNTTTWGTSDEIVTYGGSDDLWGETWTASDINDADFGFALSIYDNSGCMFATGSIDHISITVYYPGGAVTKSGLISTTPGDTPFWANDTNPRTISLNQGESVTIGWSINATGTMDGNHTFFIFANITENPVINDITTNWTVGIRDVTQGFEAPEGDPDTSNTTAPLIFDSLQSPTSPTVYQYGKNYTFSVNITDPNNVSTVLFEIAGINFTPSNVSSIYSYTISQLSAANHTYRWFANDTYGNINHTEGEIYTINKANLSGTVSGTSPINEGVDGDVFGSESNLGDSDVSYSLYRNGTLVSNPDTSSFSEGSYGYIFNNTEGTNYTSSVSLDSFTLSVLPVTRTIFLGYRMINFSNQYPDQYCFRFESDAIKCFDENGWI